MLPDSLIRVSDTQNGVFCRRADCPRQQQLQSLWIFAFRQLSLFSQTSCQFNIVECMIQTRYSPTKAVMGTLSYDGRKKTPTSPAPASCFSGSRKTLPGDDARSHFVKHVGMTEKLTDRGFRLHRSASGGTIIAALRTPGLYWDIAIGVITSFSQLMALPQDRVHWRVSIKCALNHLSEWVHSAGSRRESGSGDSILQVAVPLEGNKKDSSDELDLDDTEIGSPGALDMPAIDEAWARG